MRGIKAIFDEDGRCTGKCSGNVIAPVNAVSLTAEQASMPLNWLRLVGAEVIIVDPSTPAATLPPLLPLSARQIRLALAQANLLDQVEAAVAQAPEASRIEWQYANTYDRGHPLIASIAQALGLTDSQIEDMWRQAETL